jgi:hypothetical protein
MFQKHVKYQEKKKLSQEELPTNLRGGVSAEES